jgi:hypothetical protein
MARTHKLVRDAVTSLLSDSTYGLNVQLAALLTDYSIPDAIRLEWENPSRLAYGRIGSADVHASDLTGKLTLNIQPDGSQWTGETKGIKWSGRIGVRLVFRIRYSLRETDSELGDDDDAVTAIATAIEDAVIEVFQRTSIDWGALGVVYAKPPDCPEGYLLTFLKDGVEQEIPISIGFTVDAV